VSKFLMPRNRTPRSLNRREFLSSGILAAAGPIFPVFRNLPVPAASSPVFEIKPMRGVDFILQNSPTRKKFLIETMPGGIALFDYNNDGLLDIFCVNGGASTERLHLPENFDRSNPRYWNRLSARIAMEALPISPKPLAWPMLATATMGSRWQWATTTTTGIPIFL